MSKNLLNERQYLLICLNEECAEVQHRISKALRFGFEEIEPGQNLTNSQRISGELTDLLTVASMLKDAGFPLTPFDQEAKDLKTAKVKKYMKHSQNVETLEAL